jgi:hypothetical protein
MDDHASWLVDDEKSLVLVNHGYRDVLARDRPLFDLRNLDPNDSPRLCPIAGLFTPAVNQHMTLGDQSRRLGSRKCGSLGNKEIEADIAVRLDWKIPDVTQSLDLRLRIRYRR